jgi:hypothetical protein
MNSRECLGVNPEICHTLFFNLFPTIHEREGTGLARYSRSLT